MEDDLCTAIEEELSKNILTSLHTIWISHLSSKRQELSSDLFSNIRKKLAQLKALKTFRAIKDTNSETLESIKNEFRDFKDTTSKDLKILLAHNSQSDSKLQSIVQTLTEQTTGGPLRLPRVQRPVSVSRFRESIHRLPYTGRHGHGGRQ